MTRVSGPWLDRRSTQTVLRTLTEAGHQALLVGGCVRNALLGLAVRDIDIATDAHPDRVTDLCEQAGLKVVPTGIEHGTVTVVSEGLPHEITTFRRDVATDGRHATVAFGESLVEDARRRDFTMNALYATPAGEVVDPLGGLPDLRARRVRFIDDADQRIKEDFLRILRFFRFHALYGDLSAGLDTAGLAACAANVAGLETLSKERVGAEMKKLLAAPDPSPSVAAMARIGVLAAILPGASADPLPVLVHLEQELGLSPDPIRRLAALSMAVPDCAARLRLSRAEARALDLLRHQSQTSHSPGELGYRLGAKPGRDVLLLRAALLGGDLQQAQLDEVNEGANAVFPVQPADLMPQFHGPALGERLTDLESEWIASGFSLTREQLLA